MFKLQAQIQIGFVWSSVKGLSNGAKMPCRKYHFVDIGNGMKEMVLSKSSILCTLKCMKVRHVYVALSLNDYLIKLLWSVRSNKK